MENVLIPFKSVGKYNIGGSIDEHIEQAISVDDEADSTGWITYSMKDGIDLYVEENKIISICCTKTCYYNGLDLIGLSTVNFEGILGLDRQEREVDKIYLDSRNKKVDVVEYDEVGIQAWIDDDEIINLICNDLEDE